MEELVADRPYVCFPPGRLIEIGKAIAPEQQRQRNPALRQHAVLRLQPVIDGQPVAVATGEMHNLIECHRFAELAADGHRPVAGEHDYGHGITGDTLPKMLTQRNEGELHARVLAKNLLIVSTTYVCWSSVSSA